MAFYISRYKNKASEEFDIEVVTPMFLGGANPQDVELRVPSIKGMLRFWWRATCGIESLKKMKEKEAKIFGSTDIKASFSIQIEDQDNIKPVLSNLSCGEKFTVKSKNRTFRIGIIDYLAFGLRDFKKGYTKKHIPSGSNFKIKFLFHNNEYQESVLKAFYAFINNGGLGAKSRNGFGSLYSRSTKEVEIQPKIRMGQFTALSNKSDLFKFKTHNRWDDALSEIGKAYKDARLSVEKKHEYNKRLLIAMPIVQTRNKDERHSKPYFLHINKLENGKFQGQILFMPYQYYKFEKRNMYMQVCEEINGQLAEISGGPK